MKWTYRAGNYLLLLIIGGILTFCANPSSPTGGERDKTGPQVVKTIPVVEQLNFTGKKITVIFDEFIRPVTYGKEIFVSPLLKTPPKVLVAAKKLTLQFQEDLLPNTTYVITLAGVKDQNESNEMEVPFPLAFSTGPVIDSMEIKGRIEGPVFRQGMKDMTLLLFDADSIENDDIFRRRPAYISRTDEAGYFSLPYLRRTDFRIYAIEDADNSNTYSSPLETLALADSSLVQFTDSGNSVSVSMLAFSPDDQVPLVRAYEWLSDSVIRMEFSEGLMVDSLQLSISDTTGLDSMEVTTWTYWERKLLVLSHRKRESGLQLALVGMQDSLGNVADSLMEVLPRRIKKPSEPPLEKKPKLILADQTYQWISPRTLTRQDTNLIHLQDTTPDVFLPYVVIDTGFQMTIKPVINMNPGLAYTLNLEGELFRETDTVFSFLLDVFDPDTYGRFSGKIVLNGYEGPLVVTFAQDQTTFVSKKTDFDYRYMPAGNYLLTIVLDADSNGIHTPGSLAPYRLPERIYQHPTKFEVRAKWEFTEQVIEVDLVALTAPPIDTTAVDTIAVEPRRGKK
ncbi:MAG: Ig-like domain-containing protein [Bacteroidota bacterium]